jgi:hypothetical protein
MDLTTHAEEGKITATCVLGLRSFADKLYILGLLNNNFSSQGHYATPDAMETEVTEIDPDAMEAVTADAFQGAGTEADVLQGDTMEVSATDSNASEGDVYDVEDSFEGKLSDGDVFESVSQGKKLTTSWKFAQILTNNYLIESDSLDESDSEIEASDLDTTLTAFIKKFPFGRPGAPTVAPHTTGSGVTPSGDSIWAPFSSQREWEIAEWAKTEHMTASAFTKLLALTEVREYDRSSVSRLIQHTGW